MTWVIFITLVLIWTVIREALIDKYYLSIIDKYAHAKHPNNMRNSGIIVGGCLIASFILLIFL